MPTSDPTADWLNCHQPALLRWAEAQTPAWLRGKLDALDLVQQTLLEALHDAGRVAALPAHEALRYLRRILTNNLFDAVRKYGRGRGDVAIEAAAASSLHLADWLAAPDSSPSERAARSERYERLVAELARLPDDQRQAVEMRYLRGAKVADIAARLGRSEGAVSALLFRAIAALRAGLGEEAH